MRIGAYERAMMRQQTDESLTFSASPAFWAAVVWAVVPHQFGFGEIDQTWTVIKNALRAEYPDWQTRWPDPRIVKDA